MIMKRLRQHTSFASLVALARAGGAKSAKQAAPATPAKQAKPARREPALTVSNVKSARVKAERETAKATDFSHLANMSRAQLEAFQKWQEDHRLARIVQEIADDI